jgi:hypothetical protein
MGGDIEIASVNPETGEPITAKLGDTAQVVQISPDGAQTVAVNLASLLQGMEASGGNRLALLNNTLYATTGFWIEDAGPDAAPNMAIVAKIEGSGYRSRQPELERDQRLFKISSLWSAARPDGNLWVTDAGANDLADRSATGQLRW